VRNCRHTKDQVRFKKTLQLRRTLWNSPIRGNHSFHDFGFDAPDLRCEFQPLFQTNDSKNTCEKYVPPTYLTYWAVWV
jgi:hypothetical protein